MCKTLEVFSLCPDLDSFTSSLLYAYVRSSKPPERAFSQTYVPLLNIPKEDIALRPEFLALLPQADLQSKDLITLSDLPDVVNAKATLPPENTKWILVDHNSLQGSWGSIYGNRVAGVIDHHEEEHKVPVDTGDEPRIIEKAGSCTSLVANYCQESWKSLITKGSSVYDAQLAKVAMASILIDTNNLQSKEKLTPHDEEAVASLEAKIAASTESALPLDRTAFFEEIRKAKSDIGSLKLQDILRKDYKQWTENGRKLGISSIVKPIPFLQQKADAEQSQQSQSESLVQALDRFAKDRDLALYAVMTTSTSAEGEFQRELMVKAFTDGDARASKNFADAASQDLGLIDWDSNDMDNISSNEIRTKVWWQRNVQHSRKRVAPLLREAMK